MTEINAHNGVDTTHERGHWMTVSDGIRYTRFYPLDPRPEEINIGIIAHHLSRLTRFTGATVRPYWIAEHCMLVGDIMWNETGDPHAALVGLLHDAPEAFLNDINRPLKTTPEMYPYRAIEQRVWEAVCARFGMQPDDYSDLLKEVDIRLCATEKRDLLPGSEEWTNMPPPYDDITLVQEHTHLTAKTAFLASFHSIMEAIG